MLMVALVGVGCSSSESPSEGSTPPAETTPPKEEDKPVSATALTGTVGGQPFVGKVALANYEPKSGVANIFIFDRDRTCENYASADETGWAVTIAVRWQSGVSGAIGKLATLNGAPVGSSSNDVISVMFRDRPPSGEEKSSVFAHTGRVEVIEASPDKASRGRVRVRASEGEHHVEGEMPVEICVVYPDE